MPAARSQISGDEVAERRLEKLIGLYNLSNEAFKKAKDEKSLYSEAAKREMATLGIVDHVVGDLRGVLYPMTTSIDWNVPALAKVLKAAGVEAGSCMRVVVDSASLMGLVKDGKVALKDVRPCSKVNRVAAFKVVAVKKPKE